MSRAEPRRRQPVGRCRGVLGLLILLLAIGPAAACGGPDGKTSNNVTVFIGDSYTFGTGASSPAHRWSTLVSESEGWTEVNLGRGGTGYVATATYNGCGRAFCGNYLSRVDEAAAAHPARVVVAGGGNDFSTFVADPAEVQAAVVSTFTAIRKACPDAQLIVIGPSTPRESATVTAFDQVVRTAAADAQAHYVSLLQPSVITPTMLAPDGAHVNDSGHRAIADRVIAQL